MDVLQQPDFIDSGALLILITGVVMESVLHQDDYQLLDAGADLLQAVLTIQAQQALYGGQLYFGGKTRKLAHQLPVLLQLLKN